MFALLLTLACTGSTEAPEAPTSPGTPPVVDATTLQVRTLSHPADYLVRRLGGEGVSVTCVLPAEQDPYSWQPDGELVAGLAEADLIVSTGRAYDAWLKAASLPSSRLVDSSEGLELIQVEGPVHSHGGEGAHSHHEVDPHTWLDPQRYAKQARAVHKAMAKARPGLSDSLKDNLATLEAELQGLDKELETATMPLQGAGLFASDAAYAYLAQRYGLELHEFSLDPAALPSDEQRLDVGERTADLPGPILFWAQQPEDEVVRALPPGLRHVVLDPLEQPGEQGYDYMAQAADNLKALRALAAAVEAGD